MFLQCLALLRQISNSILFPFAKDDDLNWLTDSSSAETLAFGGSCLTIEDSVDVANWLAGFYCIERPTLPYAGPLFRFMSLAFRDFPSSPDLSALQTSDRQSSHPYDYGSEGGRPDPHRICWGQTVSRRRRTSAIQMSYAAISHEKPLRNCVYSLDMSRDSTATASVVVPCLFAATATALLLVPAIKAIRRRAEKRYNHETGLGWSTFKDDMLTYLPLSIILYELAWVVWYFARLTSSVIGPGEIFFLSAPMFVAAAMVWSHEEPVESAEISTIVLEEKA